MGACSNLQPHLRYSLSSVQC
uniref:Uncharacterized protein n=1 Tax=Anguilla anguilla TaxID=7936 RepID=A0A0E9QWC6_ANGAN